MIITNNHRNIHNLWQIGTSPLIYDNDDDCLDLFGKKKQFCKAKFYTSISWYIPSDYLTVAINNGAPSVISWFINPLISVNYT